MKEHDVPALWTVYKHPLDFPHDYVARRFQGEQPTEEVFTCKSLLAVQRMLAMRGLVRIPRQPGDDANIVEVWL